MQRIQKSTWEAVNNDTADRNKIVVLYDLEEYYAETEENVHEQLIYIFQDSMSINMESYIEEFRRIGKKGRRRSLVIELTSKKLTKRSLQHRQLLKNTDLTITEYLDENSLRIRKQLVKILQDAKEIMQ